MHALNLIAHLEHLTPSEADEWLTAALAEARALRQHDGHLYPLTADPAAMQTAKEIHEAWRRWFDGAQALLKRLSSPLGESMSLRRDELRLAIGFAGALMKMPPEEILRRQHALDSGQSKLISAREARRELGLAPRP